MSAQPQHHEWTDEDRTAEDHAAMVARLQAAVAEADRRALRARLARASRPVSARTFLASRGR